MDSDVEEISDSEPMDPKTVNEIADWDFNCNKIADSEQSGGRYRREYKFISLNIRIRDKIAQGTFSIIRRGIDMQTNEEVAVKIEDRRSRHSPQLLHESEVYSILQGGVGIPNTRRFGVDGHYNVLVMSLHGPCLEELLTFCGGRFTLKTVLMLADQMIDRIEFVHSKSFVHRDIKPQNFLVGAWEDRNQVYLIDFGLAKKYRDSTNSHIPHRENTNLAGTLRYTSMNHHSLGIAQSRRDDLESLGYVLMYFLNGRLPWQGLRAESKEASSKEAKREKIKSVKSSMSIEALCADHPREFVLYFEHCRSLQFSDQPDYAYLKRIFRELFIREGFEYDNLFDWLLVHQEARVYQQARPIGGAGIGVAIG